MEILLKPHIPLGCNWNILWLEGLLKEQNEPQTTPEIVYGYRKLANYPTWGKDLFIRTSKCLPCLLASHDRLTSCNALLSKQFDNAI